MAPDSRLGLLPARGAGPNATGKRHRSPTCQRGGHIVRGPGGAAARSAVISARRAAIQSRLQADFPDFSRLLGQSRTTITEVQSALKPDQALVLVYSNDEGTFIWAIRPGQNIGFAHIGQSEADLQALAIRVRQGLDFPDNSPASIPRFDVAAAHELYGAVLAPVADTWRGADELNIVPHGAMAQIPWSLLITEPFAPTAVAGGLPFAEYRSVPWLFRLVSVAHLPSIGAFQALASEPLPLPRGRFSASGRRCSAQHSGTRMRARDRFARWCADACPVPADRDAKREQRASFRSDAAAGDSGRLREVARALGADRAHDLLLGVDANEEGPARIEPVGPACSDVCHARAGRLRLDGPTQPAQPCPTRLRSGHPRRAQTRAC